MLAGRQPESERKTLLQKWSQLVETKPCQLTHGWKFGKHGVLKRSQKDLQQQVLGILPV